MLSHSLAARGLKARANAFVVAAALAGLAACSSGDSLEPQPTTPAPTAQDVGPTLRRAAFILDVNVPQKKITITNPTTGVSRSFGPGQDNVAFSLLGEDAISLTATNFFASAPGALQPNRTEVFFDLAVTNLLPGITLTTPTLPTPPAGQQGLILFPFSTTITTSSGGAGGTGGGDVVVELPSRGGVLASRDWNGSSSLDRPTFPVAPGAGGEPHNFFNDLACAIETSPEVASDCFRYETYGNLAGGATGVARRVGFSIDAGVSQFRVRIIAAADLLPGAIGAGSVAVNVSSPQRGPIAGIPVVVTGGTFTAPSTVSGTSQSATTSAAGAASFANVVSGVREVWLGAVGQLDVRSLLPAGCTRITPVNGQVVNLAAGGAATVNFSVECEPLLGALTATITRTGTGTQSLDGSTYTVAPTAAGLTPVIGQLAGLGFAVNAPIGVGAGAGEGSVTLSNLPQGCTSAPAAYTGLNTTTATAVALTVDCVPPAAATQYVYRNEFGAVTAGTVDLFISFDPSGFDAATIPGVDAFAGGQGTVTLTGAAASRITGRSAVGTANFGTATLGGTLPITAWSAVSTQPGGWTTTQLLAVIRYTIGAGTPGLITTASSIAEINTPGGDPFPITTSGAGATTQVIEATVNLP